TLPPNCVSLHLIYLDIQSPCLSASGLPNTELRTERCGYGVAALQSKNFASSRAHSLRVPYQLGKSCKVVVYGLTEGYNPASQASPRPRLPRSLATLGEHAFFGLPQLNRSC